MNKNWRGNFFKILLGQGVSTFTSSVLQFAIVWYLTDTTGSALVLSIAMLFGFLPRAVLGPFIGAFIDRYNRKKIMVVADLFIAAVSLIIVAAGRISSDIPLWVIYGVLFLRSIGSAFHEPTMNAVTPQLVPREELVRCSGYSQGMESISMILSPAVAAALYAVWSLDTIVILDVAGAIIAVCMVLISYVPPYADKGSELESTQYGFTMVSEGFAILRSNRGLMGLVLVSALYSLALMPISALFPLMSISFFGGTSWHAGLVEIVFAVGLLVGSLILGLTGGSKNKIHSIILSFIIMSACLLVSGVITDRQFSIFVACSFFMGLSGPLFWGMFRSLLQTGYDQRYLGRIFALSNSITVLASPIGMSISGVFSEIYGAQKWFLVAGVMTAMATVICIAVPSIYRCGNTEEEVLQV